MAREQTHPRVEAAPLTAADLAPAVVAVVLAVITWFTIFDPNLRFGIVALQLDSLINEAAFLVAAGAAGLAWVRWRQMADVSALAETAAFVLFAGLALAQLLASLGIADRLLGLDIDHPQQAPVYAWSVVRLIAAALLLRASWLRLHPSRRTRSQILALIPIVAAVAVSWLLYVAEPYLPAALGTDAIAGLRSPGAVTGLLPGVTLIDVGLQVAGFVAFAVAAYYYVRAARLGAAPAGRYLATGLVFAAFSQIHFAMFPGAYAGIVSTSDVLRVAFYAFVVFGVQAEAVSTLRRLRAANRELDELREAEVARASLSERARLAREVHDGLAQDLWVAKLATERLGKVRTLDEVRDVQAEIEDVIESSIADARETVVALRDAGKADAPLTEMLERHVRRFAAQTGLDVALRVDPIEPGVLTPRASGELLRIAQEALSNVRKHADATRVEVQLVRTVSGVTLSVRDNGVGFDPSIKSSGYGLESMRERAELAGGTARIESDVSGGTRVTVEVASR